MFYSQRKCPHLLVATCVLQPHSPLLKYIPIIKMQADNFQILAMCQAPQKNKLTFYHQFIPDVITKFMKLLTEQKFKRHDSLVINILPKASLPRQPIVEVRS